VTGEGGGGQQQHAVTGSEGGRLGEWRGAGRRGEGGWAEGIH
jgi:hypothetical protein